MNKKFYNFLCRLLRVVYNVLFPAQVDGLENLPPEGAYILCCNHISNRDPFYLALLCRKGDFFFGPIKDDDGRVVGIRIACCGDEGLNAIMKSLAFAYHAIDDQCCDVDD